MAGVSICLEGLEGAGKTTRALALKEALEREQGRSCQIVREPGGDPYGEHMRQVLKYGEFEISPWAEVFGFCSARANMLASTVAPLLAAGIDVISDRNWVSTMAYQGYGNNWSWSEISVLRVVCQAAIRIAVPDKVLVLNVSSATSASRISSRGEASDRFESRPSDYLERVRAGYIDEARYSGLTIIDAEQNEATVDAAILKEVLPLITSDKE